ncbi:MAG: hypothetical protein AB8B50_04215 [Pirellulaceae bacterium]
MAQSTSAEDQPSQRWLPLPEVKRDSVGKQTELLRMLGKLMDSSLPQELGRMSPEQLTKAQEKFQEWREKTGADLPGLESIPPEWIEQVTNDPQMQQRARRMLEQFSENRTLPDQQSNGSTKNLGPQEPIQEMMDRFNRKQQDTENDGRTTPSGNRIQDRKRLPRSKATDLAAPNNLQSQPGQDRRAPRQSAAEERSANPKVRQRNGATPTPPASENPRSPRADQPELPIGEQAQNPNRQTLDNRRSGDAGKQLRTNTPPTRNAPSQSRLRNNQAAFDNPFRSQAPAPPGDEAERTSGNGPKSNAYDEIKDPFEQATRPYARAQDPSDARNRDTETANQTSRNTGAGDSRSTPPELTPALRQQLEDLFNQLAKADALPQPNSNPIANRNGSTTTMQNRKSNSRSNSQKTAQNSRGAKDRGKNQRNITANPNRRLSTQSPKREDQPPSPFAPDLERNSVPPRNGLADNSQSTNQSLENQAVGSPTSGSRRDSASETNSGLSEEQQKRIDAFSSDSSFQSDWKRATENDGRSGRPSSKTPSLSPQQLMELAQKLQKDSKLADQIREKLKGSSATREYGRSSSKNNSTLDIESQVERFGFGQTLQSIVKKTIESEDARKKNPLRSNSISKSQNGRNSQAGTQASGDSNEKRLPSNQALARESNGQKGMQQNFNSKPGGSSANKDSTLKKLADSFWEASKPTDQSQSAQSSNSSSQTSTTPTGGISLSAPQFSMGRDTWIAIGCVAALIAAWFFFKQRGIAQAEVLKREVRWAKQAIKSGLNSRADLVRAYHSLVLNRTSPASKWWTHRYVQVQLASRIPQLKESLSELTELYEVARYAPPQAEFRAEQLDSAKAALVQLESAAA